MSSTDKSTYLGDKVNPYRDEYDPELRAHSDKETKELYDIEKNNGGKRSDWLFQRTRRQVKHPTDEETRGSYGLVRHTRNVPRDLSNRGTVNQKLMSKRAISQSIKIVIAHGETAQRAMPGSLPCIFYIHGGNRLGGNQYSGGYLDRAKVWANSFRAIVIGVDYRLSPNDLDWNSDLPSDKRNTSPTDEEPTNDCFDALAWVYNHLGHNSHDEILKYGNPAKLIVFGTSAGAGLAASTVMKWCRGRREGSTRMPGDLYGLVLEAPQLDDRCNTKSHQRFKDGNMFTSRDARQGWEVSLGDRRGTTGISIFEAPARATKDDVLGFPPTYIEVGGAEPFRDEAVAFGNLLEAADVAVETHVWRGGFHGFFAAVPNATISKMCSLTKLRWLGALLRVPLSKEVEGEYERVKASYEAKNSKWNIAA
ncbi:Alpha/Beta hydrolase protein [Xylariaceae sp. FL1651]|nr:Alpha/Beta hydrolase protein [Xylariaceae sp. FL1651]